MSKFIHKKEWKKGYFEGWYLKQTGNEGSVSLIPSWHIDRNGERRAYLQIITPDGAYEVCYDEKEFRLDDRKFRIEADESIFSAKGCRLKIRRDAVDACGKLRFGRMEKPDYDIMGPFALVPGMQCRHSVFSMMHEVNGNLTINGKKYSFISGKGYMEGDRGISFPKHYLWTQCIHGGVSVMLSAADVPVGKRSFKGCISLISFEGKQYRLATYLGAKIAEITREKAVITQSDMRLEVYLLKSSGHPLKAPVTGEMNRMIHESVDSVVQYRFEKKGSVLFEFADEHAGFECD